MHFISIYNINLPMDIPPNKFGISIKLGIMSATL